MPYLTLTEFKDRTTMPASYVDALDMLRPGWVEAQIATVSSWLDARLSKRYAVPFADPCPELVKKWTTDLVTMRCWSRRGYDPTTDDMQEVLTELKLTRDEITEAANSDTGLFELPLRGNTTAEGVSKGAPLAYSEQSPYVWTNKQGGAGRDEDVDGDGTYYT